MPLNGSAARPAITGLACALLVLAWQFLTVRYNYGGDWSGLFCTGEQASLSPVVAAEHPYRFKGARGWDGQLYHAIAHDPFLRHGTQAYVENARLRYRRILIPAAAYLLAGGSDRAIDTAYRGVVVLLFGLGAWWLARLLQAAGNPPWLGLAFILFPAAIASLDREAVDVGLLCLCCAFAYYTRYRDNRRALYAVLLCAALVRDTGLLLTAAYCIWLLVQRDFRKCGVFATVAVPTLLWYAFVNSRTEPYFGDAAPLAMPFSGVVHRFAHPMTYFGSAAKVMLIQGADLLAAAGVLFALLLAFRLVWRRSPDPVEWAIVLFALLGILAWKAGDWLEALDYARILSPLLLFEALVSLKSSSWLSVAPLGMVLPRFGIEMGAQVIGVIRGLL